MRNFAVSILAFCFAFAIGGCTSSSDDLGVAARFKVSTEAYFRANRADAEAALLRFVTSVEANIPAAQADQTVEYRKLLDISWLRLASIYRAANAVEKERAALAKAIFYFDQDPEMRADPRYMQDKQGSLFSFLAQMEVASPPAWKK